MVNPVISYNKMLKFKKGRVENYAPKGLPSELLAKLYQRMSAEQ